MSLLDTIKALSESYSQQPSMSAGICMRILSFLTRNIKQLYMLPAQLRESGIEPTEGIAQTGVMAEIKGRNPERKTIALRADMDALPIEEANDVVYKSRNPGVMHACGHDVHTSSLLGTAKILNQVKDQFEGTVRLLVSAW